jgi:hypothetical protein
MDISPVCQFQRPRDSSCHARSLAGAAEIYDYRSGRAILCWISLAPAGAGGIA